MVMLWDMTKSCRDGQYQQSCFGYGKMILGKYNAKYVTINKQLMLWQCQFVPTESVDYFTKQQSNLMVSTEASW